MRVIVSGLGRMGDQIAHKLVDGGFEVIANNRSSEKTDAAVKYGALAAYSKDDAVNAASGGQLVLWLMISDTAMEEELSKWLKIVPAGSIIIDGGNSDYRLTQKRGQMVGEKGSVYMDIGTSGGVWGYKNGFSLMCGGEEAGYKTIEPILKCLSQPDGAYGYFGPGGSGHFTKMVHNAIEYGMMESLAEGYRMLKEGPYKQIDLALAGQTWQHGSVIVSWLNDLARQALAENPQLEGIDGVVQENGETRWTLETAREIGLPMPAIQAAFDVRIASQNGDITYATKLLAAMRNKFGGHQLNPDK